MTYPTIEYPASVTIIFNVQKLQEKNNAQLGILRISFPDGVSFINSFPEYNHLIITSIMQWKYSRIMEATKRHNATNKIFLFPNDGS